MENIKPIITLKPNRDRSDLTTIQISDSQKETIDLAYRYYTDTGKDKPTKGEFIQYLASQFIRNNIIK